MDNCEVLRSAFLQVDVKYKKYIYKRRRTLWKTLTMKKKELLNR